MRWGCGSGILAQSLYLCGALSISTTRDEGGRGTENEDGQGGGINQARLG